MVDLPPAALRWPLPHNQASFGRSPRTPSTVARVTGPDIRMKLPRRHGVTRPSGTGDGTGSASAASPAPDSSTPTSATSEEGQQVQRIRGLSRAWNCKRGDVDTLRELHAVIGDLLALEKR
ncbi:hypothetical protein [Geodermatophilus obscurus]|uniref:hypothetical protein n=1 Tax=Geodermatophilus obscurus TaxID=1861 RepID=UPI000933BD39|nr:hypothetical protein [Geodermatophilus obscurus]